MSNVHIALVLAWLGVLGLVIGFGFWSKHHPRKVVFPRTVTLACIGGWLSLCGALCFAVAAFLGG